jgi:hypothetical protein
MITSKTLLITSLSFLAMSFNSASYPDVDVKDCNSFRPSYKVAEKTTGQTLDINIEGGMAPFAVILSTESGDVVTDDFSLRHFEALKSGKYTCIIVDKQGCRKKFEITIQ